jgi:hypothetical protein
MRSDLMPLRGVASCYRTGSGSDRIQALNSVVRVVVGEDLFSSRPLRSGESLQNRKR